MTNEEVIEKMHEEFVLRGMSESRRKNHIYVLCDSFYAIMKIVPLKPWVNQKSENFCCIKSVSGKQTVA